MSSEEAMVVLADSGFTCTRVGDGVYCRAARNDGVTVTAVNAAFQLGRLLGLLPGLSGAWWVRKWDDAAASNYTEVGCTDLDELRRAVAECAR